LGAQRRSILLSIGWNTIVQTAMGLLAGTIISLLATRAVRKLLELQQGSNFSSLLLGAAALLVVVVFAVVAPARRAALIDPMEALRSE
jgi:putative ABC transport system permease protein